MSPLITRPGLMAGAGLLLILAVFWLGGRSDGAGGGTAAPDVTKLDPGMTQYKVELDSYAKALKAFAEGDTTALPAAMPTLTEASPAPSTHTAAQPIAPTKETNP